MSRNSNNWKEHFYRIPYTNLKILLFTSCICANIIADMANGKCSRHSEKRYPLRFGNFNITALTIHIHPHTQNANDRVKNDFGFNHIWERYHMHTHTHLKHTCRPTLTILVVFHSFAHRSLSCRVLSSQHSSTIFDLLNFWMFVLLCMHYRRLFAHVQPKVLSRENNSWYRNIDHGFVPFLYNAMPPHFSTIKYTICTHNQQTTK